ncbi:CAF17-like 4Fe-4S cluster assembly/insertion protein YgfZ [Sanguibacter sp. A247]|uniref:CAF17-like 4Fe-4S cluster assembly/insertion protein YgfZ n=1 Tax=unclassified Sanguibacter TaxID=2645534 RepID=UPI003FD838A2
MTESATPARRSPLLGRHGAVAALAPDEGVAWHYGDPFGEQRALDRRRAFADQSHTGVVTVTGPDRLTWLHSITSQHLTDLPPRTSTELLVLDPHGHVEHAVGVVDDGTTTWLLTAGDHAAPLAAWLDRMRFMMRVEIADVTDEWAAIGENVRAEGQDGEPVTWVDPWPTVAPGSTRYGPDAADHPGSERAWRLVLVPRASLLDEAAAREASGWTLVGTWATEAARVAALRPRVDVDVDDRTIPHELDWLRTSVHLAKGCYRGQETVARVHNLGRPPRRIAFAHLDGSENLLPVAGAEVTVGERVVGRATSVAMHHELGPIALVMLKRNVDPAVELVIAAEGGTVAATQEVIVAAEGVTPDRPAPRAPVARGLAPRQRRD